MKRWHIAALVVVGLIVLGIAYAMYQKRNVVPIRKSIGVGNEYRKRKNRRRSHLKTIERENKRAKKDDTHYYNFDDLDEYS